MRCAKRPAMRLARPGTLVCSWTTRGTPAARAASATGSATKPPVANTRSGSSPAQQPERLDHARRRAPGEIGHVLPVPVAPQLAHRDRHGRGCPLPAPGAPRCRPGCRARSPRRRAREGPPPRRAPRWYAPRAPAGDDHVHPDGPLRQRLEACRQHTGAERSRTSHAARREAAGACAGPWLLRTARAAELVAPKSAEANATQRVPRRHPAAPPAAHADEADARLPALERQRRSAARSARGRGCPRPPRGADTRWSR